jgi:hypothetical protein
MVRPVYLLADSQWLFQRNEQQPFLKKAITHIVNKKPKAAYIGISNGDTPAFYSLFCEAMNAVDVVHTGMITSIFRESEQEFLESADIILLSGGDTQQGLKVFQDTGIARILRTRYQLGATLIGVSAGAIQLGSACLGENIEPLKIVPFIVTVHADKDNFREIDTRVGPLKTTTPVYEIPLGAGLIYYPNGDIEAVGKPINKLVFNAGKRSNNLVFPFNFNNDSKNQ